MVSTAQALQAQALHQQTLLQKANVVGVAVGFKESKGDVNGEVAVVVLVEQKKPLAALSAEDVVPPEIDGMRTDVYEVGHLRAQMLPNPRQEFRPMVPNGVSVGHYKVTAGTLGTIVRDRTTRDLLLLSNNHVLANCNDAELGDPVLQPAAMDGGLIAEDTVARLERYIRLRFVDDPITNEPPIVTPEPTLPPDPSPTPRPTQPPTRPTPPSRPGYGGCSLVSILAGVVNAIGGALGADTRLRVESRSALASAQAAALAGGMPTLVARASQAGDQAVPENTVDCALARPEDPAMFSDDTLGIGVVNGIAVPHLGMRVRKFGRTSGYTEGNITLMNATVNVAYSTAKGTRTARFVGQIITEAMSQGGDSGSLIVDVDGNNAVGLLFAGSNLATIFTPIDLVLSALDVTLD